MSSFDLSALVRENVKRVKPYSSARDEFTGKASVYLDANENPFHTRYNRYPDPHQSDLKKKIALLKETQPERLFLGNGSDEAIDLLFRVFCEPGRDNVLIPQPTYGMYSVSAAINDVAVRSVDLTPDFDLDVDTITRSWNTATKLLFLCSPNNPSGNLLDPQKVRTLVSRFQGLVVLDEAYIDFTTDEGFLPRLDEFPNLVVLQTFSKAWGLAGIRLGMCFASPEVIALLDRIKPPYNINSMTLEIASSYLADPKRKDEWVDTIRKERDVLEDRLRELQITNRVYPSDANFLLVQVADAKQTYRSLVDQGIIVRDRSNVILCDNCLRITVGTELENKKLIEAMKQL